MVFGSKAKRVKVFMNAEVLQEVPTFKYLGFTLDSTLSYNHHMLSVSRTVLHRLTLLAKMKRYLNTA